MLFLLSLIIPANVMTFSKADFQEYQVNQIAYEVVDKLIMCESSGKATAFNPRDVDGKEKLGCLQYDTDTASEFLKKYGMYGDWEIEDLKNWLFDCEFSKRLAVKMVVDGYAKRWGCYKKTTLKN